MSDYACRARFAAGHPTMVHISSNLKHPAIAIPTYLHPTYMRLNKQAASFIRNL